MPRASLQLLLWLVLALPFSTASDFKLENLHLAEGKLITASELRFHRAATPSPIGAAVTASLWPPGLVPVFQIERQGKFELRRLPPKGQENFSEPICFILPLVEESASTNIAGRWDVRGTREGASTIFFGWEFSTFTNRLMGRFGQETDYRFAFIPSATFTNHSLTLQVDYISDKYEVIGTLQGSQLKGTWRRTDDFEKGTWEASRPDSSKLPELPATILFLGISPTAGPQVVTSDSLAGSNLILLGRVWPPQK